MRRATLGFLGLLTLCGASASRAADLDYGVLRGPEYDEVPVASTVVDWSGVYVGGHGGYTSGAMGFRTVFQTIVANALRNSTFESDMHASGLLAAHAQRVEGGTFGGYVGYNMQFDDIVLGIEADYTHAGLVGTSTDEIARFMTTTNGYYNAVDLAGIASTKIQDYGTVRGRAGYAFGNVLPFVTAGLAIGRARISDTVAIQAYEYDQATYKANLTATTPAFVANSGYSKFYQANPSASVPAPPAVYGTTKTKTVGGGTLGAGIEYAITPSILLRAEYQYVLFNDFDGHKLNLNTVRGGAAVKF